MPTDYEIDKARIEKKMDFWFSGLKVGRHVECRYNRDIRGRIEELVIIYPEDKYSSVSCHGKFRVRLEDGTFELFHPEHLDPCKPPKPEAVNDDSLFNMMAAVNMEMAEMRKA